MSSLYANGSNTLTPPNEEMIRSICEHGQLYSPVTLRYNFKCSVICDRCYKKNLDACVSYDKYDLCTNCVDVVRRANKITNPIRTVNPQPNGLLNEKINNPNTNTTTNTVPPEEDEEEPLFNLFD